MLHGPRIPSSELQMPEIERNRAWMIAAAVLAIVFIAGLGPGVSLVRSGSGRSPRHNFADSERRVRSISAIAMFQQLSLNDGDDTQKDQSDKTQDQHAIFAVSCVPRDHRNKPNSYPARRSRG